uniref:Ig-like domain-containing protein n=1 Tax=Denticeps clupeoides TaxID=299321 RepID=A0AAY4CMK0_9TELE
MKAFQHVTLLTGLEVKDNGEVVYRETSIEGVVEHAVTIECGSTLPNIYIWSFTKPGTDTIRAVVFNFGGGPKLQKLAETLGNLSVVGNSASLAISKLPVDAEGLYTCQALYDNGPDVPYVDVTPYLLTEGGYAVMERETVTLSCQASSNPSSMYIWFYDNSQVNLGPRFTINKTLRVNSGQYTCQAQNSYLNRSSEKTIPLTVFLPLSKPHITLSSSSPVEGTLVTMLCTLDKGTGPISYILEQESRDGVTTAGSASNYALFNISRITRNHTGWYWCLAKNDVSQQRSNRVWLDVIYGPDLPQIVTLLNVTEQGYLVLEKETVSLVCQAASNPPSQYVWLYNSSKVYVGSQLVIPKIQRMQTGQYGCLAQNMYLNSSTKMTINITVYCKSF